jgi:nickel-dependent lactate racemase
MTKSILNIIADCDTRQWQSLSIPFAEESFNVRVPSGCVTLRMQAMAAMETIPEEILHALEAPIGSPRLCKIIADKGKPPEQLLVRITVSDITRPVPYKGTTGMLGPLLGIIEATGVRRENIVMLIGNGMHRGSTLAERVAMYGQDVVDRYRIVDHDCDDLDSQVLAAHTSKSTEVHLNRIFYQADVKIVTGLVESHFMAGASGGRKGVCPALVNTCTLHKFHGVDFLEHPHATNLIPEDNPCHEEALEVARAAGVDFLVNTTLDHELKLTGVYAGDLEAAHQAAFETIKAYVSIPITEPYDIVITHGGYVGRNHYQCAKAAVGAMPAVKENGFILLAANNFDVEPVRCNYYPHITPSTTVT